MCVFFLTTVSLFVRGLVIFLVVFCVYHLVIFLVVSTGTIDCLERLIPKMTCNVSSEMLNSTLFILCLFSLQPDTSLHCETMASELHCVYTYPRWDGQAELT